MSESPQPLETFPKPRTAPELQQVIYAEREGKPFIYYRDAEDQQVILVLSEGSPVSVGRSESSGIVLDFDQSVSGVHAILSPIGDSWVIEDDGLSRNGTYLNGLRLRGQQRLRDRDWIRFGETTVVYRSPSDEAASETRAASEEISVTVTGAQKRVLVALCRPMLRDDASVPATTAQIADELVVSPETVKSHLRELFVRFELADVESREKRHVLAQKAIQSGTVSDRDY